MSSCRYRCLRSAPVSSFCAAQITSPTVVVGDNFRRIGTTLAIMPPERRSAAVVRPETGRLSTTSGAPVIAAR